METSNLKSVETKGQASAVCKKSDAELKQELENFKPSEILVLLAECVLIAKAYVKTIRPIVRGYQTAILTANQWENKWEQKVFGLNDEPVEKKIIVDPELTYLLCEDDFNKYLCLCEIEMKKAGLYVERKGDCPLLYAEHMERKGIRFFNKQILLELPVYKGLNIDDILCAGIDKYEQFTNLNLQLLSKYVHPIDDILNDFLNK